MFGKRIYAFILMVMLLSLFALPEPLPQLQAQSDGITIGTLDLPTSFDPAAADNFMVWEILSHLYVGLTRQVTGTTQYELAAATDWTVSDDQFVHTFTLRSDLQFSDGSPITAQTYADSISRILRLDYGGAGLIKSTIQSVTAISPDVLEFRLIRPIPYFDAIVALPPFFAYHPDNFPPDELDRETPTLIGNGVYLLDAWKRGDFVRLKANPDYQFGEPAKTDTITLKWYRANEELRQAIRNHEIDIAWRDLLLTDAAQTASEIDTIVHELQPSTRMWYLVFNADPQYDNSSIKNIRQAIFSSIDRQRITTSYFNKLLTPALSLVPEMLADSYTPLWGSILDGESVVALLTDAGIRRNNNIGFQITSTRNGYGDYYADVVRSFSVDFVALRPYMSISSNSTADAPVFYSSLEDGDRNTILALFAWTPIAPHPDAYLRPLLHSEGLLARGNHFESAELDALLDEARLHNDASLYQAAQQVVFDTYTLAPMWQDTVSIVYWNDIDGVAVESNYFLHYDLLARH